MEVVEVVWFVLSLGLVITFFFLFSFGGYSICVGFGFVGFRIFVFIGFGEGKFGIGFV